jgi:hypothetical protein
MPEQICIDHNLKCDGCPNNPDPNWSKGFKLCPYQEDKYFRGGTFDTGESDRVFLEYDPKIGRAWTGDKKAGGVYARYPKGTKCPIRPVPNTFSYLQ